MDNFNQRKYSMDEFNRLVSIIVDIETASAVSPPKTFALDQNPGQTEGESYDSIKSTLSDAGFCSANIELAFSRFHHDMPVVTSAQPAESSMEKFYDVSISHALEIRDNLASLEQKKICEMRKYDGSGSLEWVSNYSFIFAIGAVIGNIAMSGASYQFLKSSGQLCTPLFLLGIFTLFYLIPKVTSIAACAALGPWLRERERKILQPNLEKIERRMLECHEEKSSYSGAIPGDIVLFLRNGYVYFGQVRDVDDKFVYVVKVTGGIKSDLSDSCFYQVKPDDILCVLEKSSSAPLTDSEVFSLSKNDVIMIETSDSCFIGFVHDTPKESVSIYSDNPKCNVSFNAPIQMFLRKELSAYSMAAVARD